MRNVEYWYLDSPRRVTLRLGLVSSRCITLRLSVLICVDALRCVLVVLIRLDASCLRIDVLFRFDALRCVLVSSFASMHHVASS